VAAEPTTGLDVGTIDLDLALMLYTSGSTGNPKGVMLSHLNVMTFVKWTVTEFDITADDHLSQVAPLHFDLSTFDLYGAALAGASVHLAPRQTSMFPMEMRKFLESQKISVMYAVPSALIMLTERAKLEPGDLPGLKTLLFAGEVFPTKYLSRMMKLLPHTLFSNLYGPTETNVCTYYTLSGPPAEDAPPISIGKAITNVETFVVKEDGSLAVPGEVGELHVRGASVMQGYWGDPERTAQSRLQNVFSEGLTDPVYKTGDLVIEEADGNYTFLGRRDNQIKSRGYRIELGEIETALYAHPEIREAAAVAIPDDMITNRIKAYVVAESELDPRNLSTFLGDHIPKYMVPGEFEFRDVLPKTSTGKIDRQSLSNQ
jgi:amino acid adenylation domain-containing protein